MALSQHIEEYNLFMAQSYERLSDIRRTKLKYTQVVLQL